MTVTAKAREADRDGTGRRWWAVVVTAGIVVLLAQLVRVFMPLGTALAHDLHGVRGYALGTMGVLAAFGVSAVAMLVAFRSEALRRRGQLLAAAMVVAASVVVQIVHPIPVWLGIAALGLALGAAPALASAVRRVAGNDALVGGAVIGMAADTTIRGALSTWDLAWRDGAGPAVAMLGICAVAFAAATALPRASDEREPSGNWRLALFGPFFALQVLFLQNAPAVASQSNVSLPVATTVLILADAMALGVAAARTPPAPSTLAALTLPGMVATYALTHVPGAWVLALAVVLQVLVVALLRGALAADEGTYRRGAEGWTAAAIAAAAGAFLVLVFLYQPPARYRWPFPPGLTLALPILVLALGAVVGPSSVRVRALRPAVALVVAVLAVPSTVVAIVSPPRAVAARATDPTSVRVLTYNVHGATDLDGQVDPEATALAIEGEDPDVVILEEAGRGWPIYGTFDSVSWLSDRLGMPYVFEPAADGQLGNAILSRLPIVETDGAVLPAGDEPQRRSYVAARVRIGSEDLLVIGVHLQRGEDGIQQIDRVLAAWGGASPAVVAGDMNMEPEDPGVERFEARGLVSAQDRVGEPCEATLVEPDDDDPCERLDWIFTTPDLQLDDFAIGQIDASDHLPVAVTVTL